MTPEDFDKQFKGIDIPIKGVRLPEAGVTPKGMTSIRFLKNLCSEGFKTRGITKDHPKFKEYYDRTKYELSLIEELGYEEYFLLVWDVINFCRTNDIPVGLGRGSAAGSIVLYLIGVVGIDAVAYDLFFERFISRTRAKKTVIDGISYFDGDLLPDVDLDICFYNRYRVANYLNEKYKGKSSQILTLNTFTSKLAIKECGKIVEDKSEVEMTGITAMVPEAHGKVCSLETTLKDVENFRKWCEENPRVYRVARKLENLNKNKSTHASGYVVSFYDLLETCPIEKDNKDRLVSSYDMESVAKLNVKLDLLGLRSASVVDDVCKQIGMKQEDIDFNDPFIYQQLQDLKSPHGLFQIEAGTNYRVCRDVKPKDIEELSAVLALARPGALDYVGKYASYTNDDVYDSIHPYFDNILRYTGGVCIYQEQMMKMANKIGFTLDESEILRRIVGKKKKEQVKEWKQKIKDKCKENKLAPEIGDVLWKVLEDSADYSFNKSHSLAYGVLAATTVYLKFKYPKEFFLALLKMTRHEPDPIKEISKIHQEMDLFGIKLLRPNLAKSKLDFSIEGDDIRFGLLSIKGVSDKSIEKIAAFNTEFSNKLEIFEGAKECGISISTLSCLIQAGMLDSYGLSRSYLVYEAQLWSKLSDRQKLLVANYGQEYDYKVAKTLRALNQEKKNEKGKPFILDKQMETIKKKTTNYASIFEQNRKNEDFANWFYENHLLGYCYGKTLRDIFKEKNENLESIREIDDYPNDSHIWLVARVEESKIRTSKNLQKYLSLEVSDDTGQMRILVFNNKRGNLMDDVIDRNGGQAPKAGDIVVIKASKKDDIGFGELVAVQSNKIYTKYSELKKND